MTAGGGSGTTAVSVGAVNGFSAGVAIAVSGLPSGVTVSPTTPTVTPGTPQTLTLTAGASAVASSSTVTVTGTSGALVHTTTFTLKVCGGAPGGLYAGGESYDGERDGGWGWRNDGCVGEWGEWVQCGGCDCGERAPGWCDGESCDADGYSGNAANAYVDGGGECGGEFEHGDGDGDFGCAGAYGFVHAEGGGRRGAGLYAGDQSDELDADLGCAGQGTAVTAAGEWVQRHGERVCGWAACGVTVAPATLSLAVGTPQTLTFTAAANAVAGTSSVSITGTSGTLTHTATLVLTVAAPVGVNVTTYHNDNARDGLNARRRF